MTGSGHAAPEFDHHQGICGAGVLFMLPALISQGLLKCTDIYDYPRRFYYSLESIILTLGLL
ncbi:MAG: hypothetical protein IPH58_18585 [Sphingobacteriales bacterium]|nr:hypothetical protein [Sphingobacteriales bacterium]